MSVIRHRARALAVASAAVSAALLAPSPLSAAPYEQVDREAGVFGDAPLFGSLPRGVALGDVGRYAGFERTPYDDDGVEGPSSGFVRDIVSNTTIDYGGGVRRIYGIDRAERRALILRTRGGKFQVVVVPIAGGAPIVVFERGINEYEPTAALSGDGRKAVVSDTSGTWLYDLTGGTATYVLTLSYKKVTLYPNGVSDTASVIVAREYDSGDWYLLRSTGTETYPVKIVGASSARVDALGTTIAYTTGQLLAVQNIKAKTEQRVPLAWNVDGVLWVGERGSKVVIGRSSSNYASPAKAYTPATNSWGDYGDRFARWINGDSWNSTPISANGRFALFGGFWGGAPVVLADTTGAHIPGANDGLAASAYIRASHVVERCTDPAEFGVRLVSPNYSPAPVKAVVTVKLDGVVVGSGTITRSQPSDYPYPLGEGPEWSVEGSYPSTIDGELTVSATVTDAAGRQLSGTWRFPDDYDCY